MDSKLCYYWKMVNRYRTIVGTKILEIVRLISVGTIIVETAKLAQEKLDHSMR